MIPGRYSLSFTTGSLFHRQSVDLAELYLVDGAWSIVKGKVIADNLLQARTVNTLKRVCREVISRLKHLSRNEIEFLVQSGLQDQLNLLWIAVCRRYSLIADFAVETLNDRYASLKSDLNHEDFDSFYNRKSEWRPELDQISPVTRTKLRQVIFKMLHEVGLLSLDNRINTAILSPSLVEMMYRSNPGEFLFFPIIESDLKGVAK